MKPTQNKDLDKLRAWLGTGSINIFGLPFCGKDTQGKRLAEMFGAPLIGGGDIIRNSTRDDVKQEISGGKLAPTDDYLAMVMPYFSKPEFAGKPLVLSSVGRWKGEEQTIVKAAEDSGHPLRAAVLLNMPEGEVVKRWQAAQDLKDRGQRADDDRSALDTRLDEFRNKTQPVIDYYRDQGLLIEVDGTRSRDEVTKEIVDKLSGIAG